MTCITSHLPGSVSSARASAPRQGRRLVYEVTLVATLFVIYNVGRVLAAQRTNGAFAHAEDVLHVERWLGLPGEQSVQAVVLPFRALVRAANGYYASVHFPLTCGVLLWLFLRHPTTYLWMRRSLVMATLVGLVIAIVLPVAPPRMLTWAGFVDTGKEMGQSTYGSVGSDWLSNQFAAMPSLHVGWALIVAAAGVAAGPARWRWLWVLHPVVTLLVVVVTGNHYWLDAAVGCLLAGTALVVLRPVPAREGDRVVTLPGGDARTAPAAATRSTTPGASVVPGASAVSGTTVTAAVAGVAADSGDRRTGAPSRCGS